MFKDKVSRECAMGTKRFPLETYKSRASFAYKHYRLMFMNFWKVSGLLDVIRQSDLMTSACKVDLLHDLLSPHGRSFICTIVATLGSRTALPIGVSRWTN